MRRAWCRGRVCVCVCVCAVVEIKWVMEDLRGTLPDGKRSGDQGERLRW